MKNIYKRLILISLISVCLLLTACRAEEISVEADDEPKIADETEKNNESAEYEETEIIEEKETEPVKTDEEEADSVNNKARYTAYKNVLLDLCNNHYLLGYEELSESITGDNMSENKFTVTDIDADGQDELVVYYTTTAVAGHTAAIYDYNEETGECYLKFSEYPLLSFYENGAMEAGWSHNQGYAGDFWPYTLYVYDKENDTYITVGYVDAYDRSLYELNKDVLESNPFPYEIDKDDNGFVYYLYSYENHLNDYRMIPAVDDDAYKAWLQQYTDGSDKIEMTFHSITEENINRVLDAK